MVPPLNRGPGRVGDPDRPTMVAPPRNVVQPDFFHPQRPFSTASAAILPRSAACNAQMSTDPVRDRGVTSQFDRLLGSRTRARAIAVGSQAESAPNLPSKPESAPNA